ncbi:putative ABC transport system permease protein [Chitinophaga rupis]|uniref:Putative ABC transport system permease protein n=1 Tax=Chitinophaga rupis TaxID=573321 RepID=A0A1H7L3K7_9BACT|nr:ABC transporter permease [Chitinophaga rupis]SEK93619.1 putative ABC transport system permease protein [Chitinophaga rupis]
MFRNYLKIAWRNLWRRKLFTVINVLGLAVGLTCVAFLVLCVQQMVVKDKFHKNLPNLYLLQTDSDNEKNVFPLLEVMLKDFPQVVNGSRVNHWDAPWISYNDKTISEEISYVDTGFLNVFTYPLKYGNTATALKDKSSIVLSAPVAEKLFGSQNPLGKVVTFADKRRFIVSAVMQPIPANASIQPKVLLWNKNLTDNKDFSPMADWYNCFTSSYVLLRPGADVAAIEKQLKKIVATRFAEGAKDRVMHLLPYREYAKKYGALNFDFYVYGLTCIAVFILLLVAINLVNLNMAVSFTRVQEVAVRKVLGSGRRAILMQFFTEVGLMVCIALLLAWSMAFIMLPVLNEQLNGLQITAAMLYQPSFIGIWLLTGALLTLVAGGYPAAYISALKLANAVKGRLQAAPQKAYLRQGLIIAQFVIAVVFIAGSLIMQQQVRYMKQGDVRFNKEQVLTVKLDLDFMDTAQARSGINHLITQLQQQAAVSNVSTSQCVPGQFWENYNTFVADDNSSKELGMRQTGIDNGFVPTYGIRILQGRNFSADMALDKEAVLINETAMKNLGWISIEGKSIHAKGGKESLRVIGVTDDYHYRSLAGSIEPLIHFFAGKTAMQPSYNYLSISIKPQQAAPVIALLKKAFSQMPAYREFTYSFADEVFNKQYKTIEGILTLIRFFTIVSVLIACAGIFALVALAAQQRTREIGIRKVLGASIVSLVSLLSKDLLKLVGIAILIAAPLAWWAMQRWLQDFAYRITISWWLLVGAGMATLAIALLTVSVQAIKAALMNPVKALKTE